MINSYPSEDSIKRLFLHKIQEVREKEIEILDLSNESNAEDIYKLNSIPEEIFKLKQLKILRIANHNISEIPLSIFHLSNLVELNLQGNNLTNFPSYSSYSISQSRDNFTQMLLGKTKNIQISKYTSNLNQLKILNLGNNNLTYLPEYFDNFVSLRELYLDYNQLTSLPKSFKFLNNLNILNLENNQLTDLSDFFNHLTNLVELYLGKNRLQNIPIFIENLQKLEILYLESNCLKYIPNFIGNLTNLKILCLGKNNLKYIPKSIENLMQLEKLYLGGNQLGKRNKLEPIPESLYKLRNLSELNMGGNQLEKISDSIGNLVNLKLLDLGGNQLKYLPQSIANLIILEKLYLGGNELNYLPQYFHRLVNLKILILRNNKLIIPPEIISEITGLKELDLASNGLVYIPKSFRKLVNLVILKIENNELRRLHKFFCALTKSTQLYLMNNPLIKPPIEVADKGLEDIKKYFRQLQESQQEERIYEAKLLVIGEAGSGKTTLAKKIINPEYQLEPNQVLTKGINITTWIFPLNNKEYDDFLVNIWDFGGQEIYYGTHQFFLTKRSLYCLVIDNCQEEANLYYWLHIVEMLSDNSPLIIIKNEKQNIPLYIDKSILNKSFTNIITILETNLETNKKLEEIRDRLRIEIKYLKHIGNKIPITWANIRERLEKYSQNYIELKNFFDICKDEGVIREEDRLQLSRYLHDIGICIHFQENQESILYRTIILQPEWLTKAVYLVLNNSKIKKQKGYFSDDDLKNIWSEEQYTNMRGELIQLMMKFRLCYKIPNNQNTKDIFIAPQLLSSEKLEYKWNKSSNLILHYTYYNFMPKGIISQFIVVMHKYIDRQKYVWKNGVVINQNNQNNTKAEVIENYMNKEIIIRVFGYHKRGFLTEICYELDKINNSYRGLEYNKLVPCNCNFCKNNQNPNVYKLDELLKRFADKILTVKCKKNSDCEVQIWNLIDNSIDFKQLFSKENQQNNKFIRIIRNERKFFVKTIENGDFSVNYNEIMRNVNINQGNYYESIAGDYYEQKGNNNTLLNITQSHSGSGDNVGRYKNTTNIDDLQDLKQSAEDVQVLLMQLEEIYPTNTFVGKVAIAEEAIQRIDNDPKLATKILNALKAGGASALDSFLDHPAASFVIAALEDWQQAKNK